MCSQANPTALILPLLLMSKARSHSSAAQAGRTHRVPAKHARRGDLVFFTSGGRVYHVGIYAGKGRVWHAPRPGERVHLERIWTRAHFFGRIG